LSQDARNRSPVNVFEHDGAPPPDARVVTAEKLE
jgi:hypothetical protein